MNHTIKTQLPERKTISNKQTMSKMNSSSGNQKHTSKKNSTKKEESRYSKSILVVNLDTPEQTSTSNK